MIVILRISTFATLSACAGNGVGGQDKVCEWAYRQMSKRIQQTIEANII